MANFEQTLSDLPNVDKDGNAINSGNPLTLEDLLVRIIDFTDPVLGLRAGETLDDHTASPYNWALLGLFLRDIFLEDKINNIDVPDSVADATTTLRGIIELATVAEAIGLSDQFRAITPHLLGEALRGVNAQATMSRRGTAEITTQAEARSGTDNERIMTSLRTLDFLRNGTGAGADTTRKGTVQRARSDTPDTDSVLYITKSIAKAMIEELAQMIKVYSGRGIAPSNPNTPFTDSNGVTHTIFRNLSQNTFTPGLSQNSDGHILIPTGETLMGGILFDSGGTNPQNGVCYPVEGNRIGRNGGSSSSFTFILFVDA